MPRIFTNGNLLCLKVSPSVKISFKVAVNRLDHKNYVVKMTTVLATGTEGFPCNFNTAYNL